MERIMHTYVTSLKTLEQGAILLLPLGLSYNLKY